MNHTSHTQLSPQGMDVASSLTFATSASGAEEYDAVDRDEADLGMDAVDPPTLGDALEFRVLRAGAPVRRLRLTGNRYTFGSADGCAIRLSDNAIRPMHAVLIRDAHHILVRAYSVPVEVNGRPTTETALAVGDVVRIGAYRFELLSTTTEVGGIASSLESLASAPDCDLFPPASEPAGQVAKERQELPPVGDDLWRERLRREVAQWRARQTECDRREARCDDRETNLRGRESELWARAEHLYRREAQLQSQEAAALQIHEEYAHKQAELIDLREETYARQRDYEQREKEFRDLESQFQKQEVAYREQVEEASRQLQLSQQQAGAATDAVQRMREQFLALNEQIEELSSQQDRIQSDEGQHEDHLRLLSELESARDQAIDAKAKSDSLREQAEQRVEEMDEQLQALKAEHARAVEDYQNRLSENDALREHAEQQVAEMAAKFETLESDHESELHEHQTQLAESDSQRLQAEQWIEELTAQLQALESQQGTEVQSHQTRLADSDGQLRDAQQRIEELTSQLREFESQQGSELQSYQNRLEDSESIAEQLRQQVEQLEQSVTQTREEAENLRAEYQGACDRVREMEESVTCEMEKSDAERANWAAEANQLREAIEQLSADLELASGELSELREANEALTSRLEEMRQQNDELREQAETRPSEEAWDAVHEELRQANEQLASLKQEYDDSLAVLEQAAVPGSGLDAESQQDGWASHSIEPLDDEESLHQTATMGDDVTEVVAGRIPTDPSSSNAEDAADPRRDDSNDSWPMAELEPSRWADAPSGEEACEHPPASNESTCPMESADYDVVADAPHWRSDAADDEVLQDVSPDRDDDVADSPWQDSPIDENEESSDPTWQSDSISNHNDDLDHADSDPDAKSDWDESFDATSPWKSAEEIEAEAVDTDDEIPWASAPSDMDSAEVSAEADSETDSRAGDEIADGSLASMLIEDFEADACHDSDEGEASEYGAGETLGPVELQPLQELPVDEESLDPVALLHASESDPAQVEAALVDVDDDSIEAYMNRLLQRVHHGPRAGGSLVDTDSPSTPTSMISEPSADEESGTHSVSPKVIDDPHAPLVPRSQAPEKHSNLSEMRKLANESARSAIDRSTRVHVRDMQIKAVTKFAFAVVALGCGGLCLQFIPGVVRYLAGAMTIVVAGVCVVEGFMLFGESRHGTSAKGAGRASDAKADSPEREIEVTSNEPSGEK